MDINTLRALSTVLVLIAFIGICWWAFSPKRRKKFEEASQLPFADEPENESDAAPEAEDEDRREQAAKQQNKG